MDIKLQVDTSMLDKWTTLSASRLLAGTAFAINHTVDRVRDEVLFPHIRSAFIIRGAARSEFFFGKPGTPGKPGKPGGAAGKFPRADRATSERLYATFGTDSIGNMGGGPGRSGPAGPILLAGFETGALRKPHTPYAKSIAVPLEGRPARPSIRGQVPATMRIANLQIKGYYRGAKNMRQSIRRLIKAGHFHEAEEFRRRMGRKKPGIFADYGYLDLTGLAGLQWKGKQRTFLLPRSRNAPLGGIFQRFGRGRDQIRMIYSFIPPFHLDTRLRYEATFQSAAPAIFRQEMEAALQWALAREAEKQLRGMTL